LDVTTGTLEAGKFRKLKRKGVKVVVGGGRPVSRPPRNGETASGAPGPVSNFIHLPQKARIRKWGGEKVNRSSDIEKGKPKNQLGTEKEQFLRQL